MSEEAPKVEIKEPKVLNSMDEIAQMPDVEYAYVPAFEPGQVFRIGSLTAGDMIEWSDANEDAEKKRTAGLRLIVKSLVDDRGNRIGKPEHLAILQKKNHKLTENIVKEILKLNGLNVKQASEAKNG